MGLFDFVKDAGEKLADKVLGDTSGGDINKPVEVSQQRMDQLRAENITRTLGELDIEGEQVAVTVQGPVATLTGTAPSQEALEKMVLCAGNQFGIAQVDCQLQVPAAPAAAAPGGTASPAQDGAQFYTVKSGDTMGKIAQQFYGAAGKYPVIFEANKPMLKDPDKIYPGQTLRIPALK